jgi:signal transduction histidine kinase
MRKLPGAWRASSEAGSDVTDGQTTDSRVRFGLLGRIVFAVGALAAGLFAVFALLIVAVIGLRHRSLEARHSQQVIATANGLQTLVIDFETGLRGFAITNQDRFLQPWRRARRRFPTEAAILIRLTADDPPQQAAARDIKIAVDAYLQDYSVPLIRFMQRNPGTAPQVAASGTGAKQVDEIRHKFTRLLDREEERSVARDARARRTAHTAVVIGAVALGATLLFLSVLAGYLERAIARPLRLAARAARRVAAGDLAARLPLGGPGEVGQLERSFNTMADSLQRSRDDLEERNRRLVESEQLKSELVSNVSHELRTPLSSILGFSDLMLTRDVDHDDRRRYLEVIRSESARLATLLNDLLDLQRHELDVLELRRVEFDLNELLSAQVTLYSAQSAHHEIALKASDEPVLLEGDRDRLAQVIGNLLSNAIKYSPNGGRVHVTTALIRGEAWVWVRDDGLGIAREHQRQIFTKFFRGDAARERRIAGTGLGLVLARQIVEAHGGAIGFDSQEGRGSTFWIRIPAVVSESAAESAPAPGDGTETRYRM